VIPYRLRAPGIAHIMSDMMATIMTMATIDSALAMPQSACSK
jgi:hypothetical protein